MKALIGTVVLAGLLLVGRAEAVVIDFELDPTRSVLFGSGTVFLSDLSWPVEGQGDHGVGTPIYGNGLEVRSEGTLSVDLDGLMLNNISGSADPVPSGFWEPGATEPPTVPDPQLADLGAYIDFGPGVLGIYYAAYRNAFVNLSLASSVTLTNGTYEFPSALIQYQLFADAYLFGLTSPFPPLSSFVFSEVEPNQSPLNASFVNLPNGDLELTIPVDVFATTSVAPVDIELRFEGTLVGIAPGVAIPEPGTITLIGLAALCSIVATRQKKKHD